MGPTLVCCRSDGVSFDGVGTGSGSYARQLLLVR